MKKLLLILPLALILCFMVGCQDKEAMAELEEFKAQAAVEDANIALFKRVADAWQKGGIEALKESFSPDFVGHSIPGQDYSFEQVLASLKQFKEMFPDGLSTAENLFAKGDKIAYVYTNKGTHTGDIEGFPATGNEFEYRGTMILRVEDGKIVEGWTIADNLTFYQQLGMELKPKEGEK